jgi:hypothetical protein
MCQRNCFEEIICYIQGQKLLIYTRYVYENIMFLSVFQTRKDTVKFTPYSLPVHAETKDGAAMLKYYDSFYLCRMSNLYSMFLVI